MKSQCSKNCFQWVPFRLCLWCLSTKSKGNFGKGKNNGFVRDCLWNINVFSMYFSPTQQWNTNKKLACTLALNTQSNFKVCSCFEQGVGPDHIQYFLTWVILWFYFLLHVLQGLSLMWGDWRRTDSVRFGMWKSWTSAGTSSWLCTQLPWGQPVGYAALGWDSYPHCSWGSLDLCRK